ncbi:hypothetical protein MRX96_015090 [Rhipicephalus microplus]
MEESLRRQLDRLKLCRFPENHLARLAERVLQHLKAQEPACLQKCATVETHFWCCVTSQKVWYEWLVSEPEVETLHNPHGRSHAVDLPRLC